MKRREFIKNTTISTIATSSLPISFVSCSEKKQKTILLWSGWDVVNIGDIGHTPGLLNVFEKYLPEVKVTLLASMLNDDVRNMLKMRFPKIEIIERDIFEEKIDLPENRKLISKFDLFIRNSNTGPNTEYMDYLIKWRKPFGVYGQSLFSWFADGDEGKKRMEAVNKADFFFCRETISLKLLQKANATCKILEFAPDGCFGIDVKDETGGLKIMSRCGLEHKKFITVQLRTHTQAHEKDEMPPGYGKWKETIENIPIDEARADKYIQLITAWVKKTGYNVLIAPEAKKEMEQNKRFIFNRLPEDVKPFVKNLDTFWKVEEAAAVFAHAHTVICHEPHSPIIALANGTPVIHTFSDEYGPKYFMFSDIGLSEWLLEHDSTSANTMIQTLFDIHDNYDHALQKVSNSMKTVYVRFKETMDTIKGLLTPS